MRMTTLAWMAASLLAVACRPLVGSTTEPTPAAVAQPSILFILADDLAWSDLACYGHPWHETPHLDALARQGMQFSDAYAPAPICSASRASILTGKTTARLHFEFVTKREPGYQQLDATTPLTAPPLTLNLPLVEQTIPEYLNGLGYETAFYGKWHLNAHHGGYLGWSPTHGPRQQGFQVAVEDFGGHPYSWKQRPPAPIETADVYPADSMVDRVTDFIRREHEQPFFLMASSFYVHTPIRSPCRWLLDKYDAKVPADSPNRSQRVTYAAFLETFDHYVGEMLTALDDAGISDETLVVFTSDNGGHPEYTANGPLRGSKWNLYEGGIRVPMLVRWPGEVAAGSTCNTPVIGYDLLPTFVEVAGGEAPPVDGTSIQRLWKGADWLPDRPLVWHFPYYHPETGFATAQKTIGIDDFAVSQTRPHSAIRHGRHKLLHFYEDDRTEFYNLDTDLSEQADLNGTNPGAADRLIKLLNQNLTRMDARFPRETVK